MNTEYKDSIKDLAQVNLQQPIFNYRRFKLIYEKHMGKLPVGPIIILQNQERLERKLNKYNGQLDEERNRAIEKLQQQRVKADKLIRQYWLAKMNKNMDKMNQYEKNFPHILNTQLLQPINPDQTDLEYATIQNDARFTKQKQNTFNQFQEKKKLWEFVAKLAFFKSISFQNEVKTSGKIHQRKRIAIHSFAQNAYNFKYFITTSHYDQGILYRFFFPNSQLELIARYNNSLAQGDQDLRIQNREILSESQYQDKQWQQDFQGLRSVLNAIYDTYGEEQALELLKNKERLMFKKDKLSRIMQDISVQVFEEFLRRLKGLPEHNLARKARQSRQQAVTKPNIQQLKKATQDQGQFNSRQASQRARQSVRSILKIRNKQQQSGQVGTQSVQNTKSKIQNIQKKLLKMENPKINKRVSFNIGNNSEDLSEHSLASVPKIREQSHQWFFEENSVAKNYSYPIISDIRVVRYSKDKNLAMFGKVNGHTTQQINKINHRIAMLKDTRRLNQFVMGYEQFIVSHPLEALLKAYQILAFNEIKKFSSIEIQKNRHKTPSQLYDWAFIYNAKVQRMFFPIFWLMNNLRKKIIYQGEMPRQKFNQLFSQRNIMKILLPKDVQIPKTTDIQDQLKELRYVMQNQQFQLGRNRIHLITPEISFQQANVQRIYDIVNQRHEKMGPTVSHQLLIALAEKKQDDKQSIEYLQSLFQQHRAGKNHEKQQQLQKKIDALAVVRQAKQIEFWDKMNARASKSQESYQEMEQQMNTSKKQKPFIKPALKKYQNKDGKFRNLFTNLSKGENNQIDFAKKDEVPLKYIFNKEQKEVHAQIKSQKSVSLRQALSKKKQPSQPAHRNVIMSVATSFLPNKKIEGNNILSGLIDNYKMQKTTRPSIAEKLKGYGNQLNRQYDLQRQQKRQSKQESQIPISFNNPNTGNTALFFTEGNQKEDTMFPGLNRIPQQAEKAFIYNNEYNPLNQPIVDPIPQSKIRSSHGMSQKVQYGLQGLFQSPGDNEQRNGSFMQKSQVKRGYRSNRQEQQNQGELNQEDTTPRGPGGGDPGKGGPGGGGPGGGGGSPFGGGNQYNRERMNQSGLLNRFIVQHQTLLKQRDYLLRQTVRSLVFKHLKKRLEILEQNNSFLENNGLNVFLSMSSKSLIQLKSDAEKYFHNKEEFYYQKFLMILKINKFDFSFFDMISEMGKLEFVAHRFIKFQKGLIERQKLLNQKITQNGQRLIPISGTEMFLATHGGTSIIKYLYNGKYLTQNEMGALTESQRMKIVSDSLLYLKQYHAQIFKTTTEQQIQREILLTQQFIKSK